MSRNDDWKRVSAMAGVDESGGILPPPEGMGIDRSESPHWKVIAASPSPVTVEEIVEVLEQLTGDLQSELDARYENMRGHAIMSTKYKRDMVPVERARSLLAKLKGE